MRLHQVEITVGNGTIGQVVNCECCFDKVGGMCDAFRPAGKPALDSDRRADF